ncbi:ribonuclease R [Mycoplasmopsis ciconiae]|uniref:Ribonuclease R n=1 Tax=Mycoplasmopsis ciconiae TaxID=561067 RepID=A0ABU7MKF8_9BACT|nr:ribonuclease R [Mycoplasmopsis ciconiae]
MINKEQIINFLIKNKSATFIEIVKNFKIKPDQNKSVTSLLQQMLQDFDIFKNRQDKYYVAKFIKNGIGEININSSGKFAFVDLETEDESTKEGIFVPKNNFNGALHKDIVEIKVFEGTEENDSKSYGVVSKIVSRTNEKLVGFLKQNNKFVDFEPLDKRFCTYRYRINNVVYGALVNDLVTAKIIRYDRNFIYVDIVEVITNETDPKVFLKAFIESVNLPKGFPEELNEELNKIPDVIDHEDKSNRVDLSNELIVTIDGESTKDFDDAINVKKIDENTYKLWVHIADVSHYVKENTQIDKEALKRGTSIYLVDRVIPMLPEKLSNGICSLNPNVKRFTITCEMLINNLGETLDVKIYPSIIESKYRLTYKQVNEFLVDQNVSVINQKDLQTMLKDAYELSQIIHKYKENQGYIDFEITEPKIILNEDGSVKDIYINERGVSEVLIEDFMVRANESVAKFLFDLRYPVMYRIHEAPDEEKMNNFRMVLDALSIRAKVPLSDITPKKFASIIESIKVQRDDEFLKLLFLRTMQKAKYSSFNIGHFGLASEFYCHFTSPIRRYPDLIIHRLLRELVFKNNKKLLPHFEEILEDVATLNSASEQKSVEIERSSNDLMYAEYFKNKIGQRYRAQVISVVKFGLFVEFENKTDALIHKSTLFDGEYEPNENMTELISEKRKFKLGDFVDVIISGVDLVEGKVDCILVEFYNEFLQKGHNSNYKKVDNSNARKS